MHAQNTFLMGAAALVVPCMAGVVAQEEPEPTPAPSADSYGSDACEAVFESVASMSIAVPAIGGPVSEPYEDLAMSYAQGEFYNTADPCELPVVTDTALAGPFSSWASAYTSFIEENYMIYRAIWENCRGRAFLEQSFPVSHYCSDLALAITSGLGELEPSATATPTPTASVTPTPTGGAGSEDEGEDEGDNADDRDNSDDGDSDAGSGSQDSGDDDAEDNEDGDSDSSNDDSESAANPSAVVTFVATTIIALACIAIAN